MGRMCSTFYCHRRGDRCCCADCPDPCGNRCLNAPDRCGLTDKHPRGRKPAPAKRTGSQKRLTREDKQLLRELLDEGTLTAQQIADRVGMSAANVYRYRALWGYAGPADKRGAYGPRN